MACDKLCTPPSASQPPAQWWGPWGPPLPWAQYYQQWPPLPPPAAPNNLTNAYGQNNSQVPQGHLGNQLAKQPIPWHGCMRTGMLYPI